MAKKKKALTEREMLYNQNVAKIQDFEKPTKEPKRYTRITHYMLMHKTYIGLSSSAKVVLLYMLDWAFASEEYIHTKTFEFSTTLLAKQNIMTNKTTITALKELEDKGFIQKENNACSMGGFTQKWSFCDVWYSGKKRE